MVEYEHAIIELQKTKFMIFHNYQRDVNHFIPEIKINGQLIERVTEFNFLGLTIDECLNWKGHNSKSVKQSLQIYRRFKQTKEVSTNNHIENYI